MGPQEQSARALGEAYVVGLAFHGARMLFSAHHPCVDMDPGTGGSVEWFPNSKSRKQPTLRSLPVCPAIVSWRWENYLYLALLSGGCRGPSTFTPLALSGWWQQAACHTVPSPGCSLFCSRGHQARGSVDAAADLHFPACHSPSGLRMGSGTPAWPRSLLSGQPHLHAC